MLWGKGKENLKEKRKIGDIYRINMIFGGKNRYGRRRKREGEEGKERKKKEKRRIRRKREG